MTLFHRESNFEQFHPILQNIKENMPKDFLRFHDFEDTFSEHPHYNGESRTFFLKKCPYFYYFKDALEFYPYSTGKWGQVLKTGQVKKTENLSGKMATKVLEIHPIFHFTDNFAPKHPLFWQSQTILFLEILRTFLERYPLIRTIMGTHHQ